MRGNAPEPGLHLIITSCLWGISLAGFCPWKTRLLDLPRTIIETLQIAEHGTFSSNTLFYSGNSLSYPKLVKRHFTQKKTGKKFKLNITGLKSQLTGGITAGYLQARPRAGLDLRISSPAP